MRQFIRKTLPLAVVGAACLSLATIGEAKAFNFVEPAAPGDAGGNPGNAANLTGLGPVVTTSTIEGRLGSGINGNPTVDLFKINISLDGLFTATTIPFNPNNAAEPDPLLYLFKDPGTVSTAIFGSSISALLTAGDYFLGITKDGITPKANNQGILNGWNANSVTTATAVAYKINLTHTPTAVPTPALLPGLVGMGLSLWRKKQKEGTMAEV